MKTQDPHPLRVATIESINEVFAAMEGGDVTRIEAAFARALLGVRRWPATEVTRDQ